MSDKFLTPEELSEFKLQEKDNQILLLERKLHISNQKLIETEMALLNAQYGLKQKMVEENKSQVKSLETKIKQLKVNTKKHSDKLKKKYKLDDKWGFDPETGKIITD